MIDRCYSDEEDEGLPPIKLTEGIDMRELLESSSTTFEVNMRHAEDLNEQPSYYNEEQLIDNVNLDCLDIGSDDEDGKGLSAAPFEKMALKMTNLTSDGKVKKRIYKPGSGPVVPERAYVTVHYNAYLEYNDEPYDSTWLRGMPLNCYLQRGNVIQGLDVGIASMKKGETSRFLIHPDMGFGKFGCPPRIPKNAELLFEVQLVNFVESAALEAIEALTEEERSKVGFTKILEAARTEHTRANEAFRNRHISDAIRRYRKAVNLLEKCHLKDEKEEADYNKMLLKLYVNLAVCYNDEKKPKLACVMCKSALDIDKDNCKALFHNGRALLMLSDFHGAKRCLLKAQALDPGNTAVSNELIKLDKKKTAYESGEKTFTQQMFKMTSPKTDEEPKSEKAMVSEEFVNSATQLLSEFSKGEKSQIPLPMGLTAQEEQCVRQIAQELGLSVRGQQGRRGERVITYIFKPE